MAYLKRSRRGGSDDQKKSNSSKQDLEEQKTCNNRGNASKTVLSNAYFLKRTLEQNRGC